MKKIKVGVKVYYQGRPDSIFTVIKKIKGAKTKKPVYHSGILLVGYVSKPTKYQLDNGDICSPSQLIAIN